MRRIPTDLWQKPCLFSCLICLQYLFSAWLVEGNSFEGGQVLKVNQVKQKWQEICWKVRDPQSVFFRFTIIHYVYK